jgi:hypothetical protein
MTAYQGNSNHFRDMDGGTGVAKLPLLIPDSVFDRSCIAGLSALLLELTHQFRLACLPPSLQPPQAQTQPGPTGVSLQLFSVAVWATQDKCHVRHGGSGKSAEEIVSAAPTVVQATRRESVTQLKEDKLLNEALGIFSVAIPTRVIEILLVNSKAGRGVDTSRSLSKLHAALPCTSTTTFREEAGLAARSA